MFVINIIVFFVGRMVYEGIHIFIEYTFNLLRYKVMKREVIICFMREEGGKVLNNYILIVGYTLLR